MVRTALALMTMTIAAASAGCANYRVEVARGGRNIKPLPADAPFRILSGPPPRGASLVGKVMFYTKGFYAEDALNEVRAKVHRIGGNLVARLGCRISSHLVSPLPGETIGGVVRADKSRIYCNGMVYRVRLRTPDR